MTVRCKFRVSEKNVRDGGNGKTFTEVKLIPIWAGAAPDGKNACLENRVLSDATPSGSVVLGIANEAAAAAFDVTKNYYVDFTPSD